MSTGRITVNGQHFDSPDEMPPEVRRMYEMALKAAPGLAGGQTTESTTQVFGSPAGLGMNVVRTTKIVVNKRSDGSLEKLPPDVRQLAEEALRDGAGSQRPGVRVSVQINRPQGAEALASKPAPQSAFVSGLVRPIEPSSVKSGLRSLLTTAAWLILGGLALRFLLGW